MRKSIPYIILGIAIVALIVLLVNSSRNKPQRFDERISLRQKDKIPYGYFAARQLAPSLFPNADFYSDREAPGSWDSLAAGGANQAVFLVSNRMYANDEELNKLLDFAQKGNHVFIITNYMSYEMRTFFGINTEDLVTDMDEFSDSLDLRLSLPRFADNKAYVYPGRRHATHISYVDTAKAIVLGRNDAGNANFLQFKASEGSVFLHTAPLAFSNYFILHKENINYFRQAFSVVPGTVDKVLWNEYYLYKTYDQGDNEPNWLGVLMQYESFSWALLTAIGTILIFVLLEMRRKQRMIPLYKRPKNESLDFVQTVGRLYYDRKDHKDLGRKMSVYFLDHVRSRYKISTNELDEQFINAVHAKSGFARDHIEQIVSFILYADRSEHISEKDLSHFHSQLESFYQNT